MNTIQLLEIFPEIKEMVPDKIRELSDKRDRIIEDLESLLLTYADEEGEKNIAFNDVFLQIFVINDLIALEKDVARFHYLGLPREQQRKTIIRKDDAKSVNIKMVLNSFLEEHKGKYICPFHHDTSPSMVIWKENNIAKCFSCDWSGDTIKFIQEYLNKSFISSVQYLNEHFN